MNNLAETIILIGGIFNLGFAVFHLIFWRLFRWKEDLASLTSINRSVMQILNLCLIFVFLVIAYISIFFSSAMISTSLGKTLLIAFSLFWFQRMIEQIIFFGIKNKVSLVFTLVFLVGSIIYALPVLVKL
jgi:hypothetical protein